MWPDMSVDDVYITAEGSVVKGVAAFPVSL